MFFTRRSFCSKVRTLRMRKRSLMRSLQISAYTLLISPCLLSAFFSSGSAISSMARISLSKLPISFSLTFCWSSKSLANLRIWRSCSPSIPEALYTARGSLLFTISEPEGTIGLEVGSLVGLSCPCAWQLFWQAKDRDMETRRRRVLTVTDKGVTC